MSEGTQMRFIGWLKDKWWKFKTRNDWVISRIVCPYCVKDSLYHADHMVNIYENRYGFFYTYDHCNICHAPLPVGPIKGMRTR